MALIPFEAILECLQSPYLLSGRILSRQERLHYRDMCYIPEKDKNHFNIQDGPLGLHIHQCVCHREPFPLGSSRRFSVRRQHPVIISYTPVKNLLSFKR